MLVYGKVAECMTCTCIFLHLGNQANVPKLYKGGKMELPCPQPRTVNDGCFNREGKGQCGIRSQKKIKVVLDNYTGLFFIISPKSI